MVEQLCACGQGDYSGMLLYATQEDELCDLGYIELEVEYLVLKAMKIGMKKERKEGRERGKEKGEKTER